MVIAGKLMNVSAQRWKMPGSLSLEGSSKLLELWAQDHFSYVDVTRKTPERAATVRVAPHEHFSPPSLEVNLFKNVAEFWLQMAKVYAKQ